MSMEIFILTNRELASIGEWQNAIDAEGVTLQMEEGELAEAHGAWPLVFDGRETAFEFDPWDIADIVDDETEIPFGGPWKYGFAFRWGADYDAGAAAYAAAAAYARATDGIVFDAEIGEIITPDQALQTSRELAASGLNR